MHNDGKPGIHLGATGGLSITSDNVPYIDFYRENATSPTSRISEIYKGILSVRGKFRVGSNPEEDQEDTLVVDGSGSFSDTLHASAPSGNSAVVIKNGATYSSLTNEGDNWDMVRLNTNNQSVYGTGSFNQGKASYFEGNPVVLRSSGDVRIQIGDTDETPEKVRITNEGNVGIGTQSPAHKLHVNGTSYLNGNVTAPSYNEVPLTSQGDGTTFLANDGTYKSINVTTLETKLTEAEQEIKALKQQITELRTKLL
ncbi:MAG: hypothetical protein LUE93_01650 [Bacteroides sp.]|nr:hypothetical protein [Bacteroides sp.]